MSIERYNSPRPSQLPPGVLDFVSPELPSPFLRDNAVFVGYETRPIFTNPENERGFATEERVGNVLKELPYVKQVVQTRKDSPEDRNLIDLRVFLIDEFSGIEADEEGNRIVDVQVKSSHWGVRSFYDSVGKRMRHEGIEATSGDEEYARRVAWTRDRKLMVINGEFRANENETQFYIAGKFFKELSAIAEFHKIKSPL